MSMENSTTEVPQHHIVWQWFTTIIDIFGNYISVPILFVGSFGNILSCFVFFTKRNQDKASAGYLGPLGFFDFWNNCNGCYYWMVSAAPYVTGGRFGRESYGESDWGCYIAWFFNMFGMYMSGFILVLFSAERCLAIWFPLRMAPILTPGRRRNAILCLLAALPCYAIVLVSYYGYFLGDETTIKGCPLWPGTAPFLQTLFWLVNVGFGSLIPCALVPVLNVVLLFGVRRGNRQMDHAKSEKDSKTANQEKRCLRNLMLVSFFYVVFMTPHGVFWAWTASANSEKPKIHRLALYSLNWSSMNYCINPILYCYSLPYYRESAVRVLSCGLAGSGKPTGSSRFSVVTSKS